MWKSRLVVATLVVLYFVGVRVSAQGPPGKSRWQTLSGNPPFVIARGGFSGLFPDSSIAAYSVALATSVPDVLLWCDVQLTSDAAGICFPNIKLDNATNIGTPYNNRTKTYVVNGVETTGYFSVDFSLNELANVSLIQGVFSRANQFDGSYKIMTVEDVFTQFRPPGYWLNVEHNAFFTQHNLSMRSYIISVSRKIIINYLSSPEVGFLTSIAGRLPRTTKFVFRFLGQDIFEPTTNQTYGSLLKNLTFIKTFASGIMVPKSYIWPVDPSFYLLPHTSLVSDAHKEGLEVFASDFVNDLPLSYNYSYDPVSEVLSYIDNGDFSVDGVLSDFPITPSEAIDCFAHLGKNASRQVNALVISKFGASGDYPTCTDLAYKEAISNGVDVLDCPVQISKDGVPFCSSSINLINSTTIAQSNFINLSMTVPELRSGNGIFSFSLQWDDIKSLQPLISNPFGGFQLFRNPKFRNSGTLVSLSDFLALTKNQTTLSGILIVIENAAYLASKQGLGVTDAVLDALSKAGYDKHVSQKVMIQSSDSSLLKLFKEKTKYERVYEVDETIGGATNSAIQDIKSFADSVVVMKKSVFFVNLAFLTGITDTVPKLQSQNLSVYVQTFSNEFVSQSWDFFSDATVELNSFITGGNGIEGVITDYPKTAARYTRNRCLNQGINTPPYMSPVQPGLLYGQISPIPPAAAPLPLLTENDVTEPPLPPVSALPPSTTPNTTPSNGSTPENPENPAIPASGTMQSKTSVCLILSNLASLLAALILL